MWSVLSQLGGLLAFFCFLGGTWRQSGFAASFLPGPHCIGWTDVEGPQCLPVLLFHGGRDCAGSSELWDYQGSLAWEDFNLTVLASGRQTCAAIFVIIPQTHCISDEQGAQRHPLPPPQTGAVSSLQDLRGELSPELVKHLHVGD